MTADTEVVKDYGDAELTLPWHPARVVAHRLSHARLVTCTEAMQTRDGCWPEAAGLVLIRHRTDNAKGVMFITMEDETGIANLLVWPQVFEQSLPVVMGVSMIAVRGRIQREGELVHLVAHKLTDLSGELSTVGNRAPN